MKAMFIAIGLIFVLGGIRAVNDPRPTLITTGGNSVRPGYPSLPISSVKAGPARYMGYAAITLGLGTILLAIKGNRLFASAYEKEKNQNPDSGRLDAKHRKSRPED